MKQSYYFITENSRTDKIKIIAALVLASLIFMLAVISINSYFSRNGESLYEKARDATTYQIDNFTPAGIFYAGFFGSLFFSPLPLELFFYFGLVKGNSLFLSFCLIMAGLIPAEIFNYFAGYKLSNLMFNLVSIKKVYSAKRWANKYGVYAIFFSNLIPVFPSPILTFALGVTKYNPARLFTILISADMLKFFLMILFYKYLGFRLDTFL